jgi:ATP-dependent protease ClpP protease subunit
VIDLVALTERAQQLRAMAGSPGQPLAWRIMAAGTSADVYLYGAIDGWDVDGARLAQEIRALDVDAINLRVNSPGGDVFDGVSVYAALTQHRATVTAHIDGLAASAASFIVQAAGQRNIVKPGRMMVHDARGGAWGPPRVLRAGADILDAVSDDMAGIYVDRAGGSVASWRRTMGEDTWYSSAEAVAAGLADAVTPVEPPPDTTNRAPAGPTAREQRIIARHRVLTTMNARRG